MNIFVTIGLILLLILLGLLAVFSLLKTWKKIENDRKRLQWLSSRQYVLLAIDIPRDNEKTPLAAEQMFAALHGIFQSDADFQEHIGFEIVAKKGAIHFFIFCPTHLRDFLEGQFYAQYPTIEITQVEDYTHSVDLTKEHIVSTELETTKEDVYPIKTFLNFTVDPLAAITAPLSKLGDEEQIWIQLLLKPESDEWHKRGIKLVEDVRAGRKKLASISGGVAGGLGGIARDVVKEAMSPGSSAPPEKKDSDVKLSAHVESALKGIEEKITKLGYATKIRIMAAAPDIYTAQSRVTSVVSSFKQFNTTNLNGFTAKQLVADSREMWDHYAARGFEDKGTVLNIEEIASIYHLPTIAVETPHINWNRAKKGEPPGNLPLVGEIPANQITVIGETNFRNYEKQFGIKMKDRARHMYIVGKSGTGKSTLMENMIIDDIEEGRGVVLVDPHGELVEHVLKCIPESRVPDVILFDPSDRSFPIGFNLLESVNEDLKSIVASGFVGIFEKMFSNSWGPRLEHILRNTVLALLDYPESTMLGIPKMLTDKKYRDNVVAMVKDPVIRDFWENEFASWDQKFASEAVAPILNKVGQFIATPIIRNIVGQKKSTFDVRKIMDEGKILLINLTRGKIGEDNSSMLGAMMITKIQLAAMSRADMPEGERTDCYMYVDEFQNFATRSFATILSEARKYHLSLVMANQYIAQMPEEVRDAVFGNVGTIISFRVGSSDATVLAHEFTPEFTDTDLVNQDIHKIYIKLSIDGMTGQAFSASTIRPEFPEVNHVEAIVEQTRKLYSRTREDIEAEVASMSVGPGSASTHRPPPTDGTINLPPIKVSPANIINGIYYKELHSKGGIKWWEGRPVEEVVGDEEKKRQKFLAKKIEHMKSGGLASDLNDETLMAEVERGEEGEEDTKLQAKNSLRAEPLGGAKLQDGYEKDDREMQAEKSPEYNRVSTDNNLEARNDSGQARMTIPYNDSAIDGQAPGKKRKRKRKKKSGQSQFGQGSGEAVQNASFDMAQLALSKAERANVKNQNDGRSYSGETRDRGERQFSAQQNHEYRDNPEQGLAQPVLRSTSYGGQLADGHLQKLSGEGSQRSSYAQGFGRMTQEAEEENNSEKGTASGERGQNSNITTSADATSVQPQSASPLEESEKNTNNLPNPDFELESGQIVDQSHLLSSATTDQAQLQPEPAYIELDKPQEHDQKAPESSTRHDSLDDGNHTHQGSDIAQNEPEQSGDNVQQSHGSATNHGSTEELEEGVPYTFS